MTEETSPLVLVPLPGSERDAAPGFVPAARSLEPDHPVEATLVLRRANALPSEGGVRSRDEFASRFGAAEDDVATVVARLHQLGLTILSTDAASRRVRISGDVTTVNRVFGTELLAATSTAPDGTEVEHRHRTGSLSIPADLDGIITAVLGLDDRPQSRAQFRVAAPHAAATSYTPVQLGTSYRFPAGTDGTGQTIAIIELGGGYAEVDLDSYFAGLGVARPGVSAVGVDGAQNGGGTDPSGADGEVLLDIEVAGALAPGANYLVYFAPNTDAGFLDAVAEAAHATPTPAAISISWGQSEDQWTAQARTAMDDAFADAAALGASVTAAAGDNGSSDGASDGRDHADFPASSPHVLACGGTRLVGGQETVWNNGAGRGATGGGVSDVFPRPSWQSAVAVPGGTGRGVPDVAAVADPETGYEVLVDGRRAVYGGTSAVAPLWAALIARLVQSLGSPLGLAHPRLYALGTGFTDVTTGDNGNYHATPGWDACTGLGTPDGEALLEALRRAA
ncbi:S53 family peptidase [Galbitalea soli]|uniref:S8/S53 family peptidase n=1 Tax=Galbitalea soli TaxID=1268042 RepID=A0A7C9PLE3_9MICO|nr:S53 family peptidase [Galbitalea soli]NEM90106.1 S8/S53 family peptidase [Galbitalea soli]NYJ30813.1 kumamolisin [Galbitalea soli]